MIISEVDDVQRKNQQLRQFFAEEFVPYPI